MSFKSPKAPKMPTITKEPELPEDVAAATANTGVAQTVSAGFDLLPNVEKLRKALGLR